MNILAIGDIVGEIGVKKIVKELPKLKEQYNIDFCSCVLYKIIS